MNDLRDRDTDPASEPELDRYTRLKSDLVEFAAAGPLAGDWAMMLAENDVPSDEHTMTMYTDMFITSTARIRGATVIGHFLEQHPRLSAEDRDLLRSWEGGAVAQVYEIDRTEGSSLLLRGLADELEYRAEVTMGPKVARKLGKSAYLFARLLPVGELWVVSGAQLRFDKRQEREALAMAAEWVARTPEVVFRNPELLAKAWELQEADRGKFMEFFGSDLVEFEVDEARERLGAYFAWRMGREPDGAYFPFDDEELAGVSTIGLLYDPVEGLSYLKDYRRLVEVFEDPSLMRRRMSRRIVEDYLQGQELGPAVLRRVAESHPGGADRVFSSLLRRKGFSWKRDGEALLREYKAEWYRTPPMPRQVPLNDRLAEAYRS